MFIQYISDQSITVYRFMYITKSSKSLGERTPGVRLHGYTQFVRTSVGLPCAKPEHNTLVTFIIVERTRTHPISYAKIFRVDRTLQNYNAAHDKFQALHGRSLFSPILGYISNLYYATY